ncbi:MAG: type II secretion system protein [bacterium]|nr:type II secretion system protein [bacterium]
MNNELRIMKKGFTLFEVTIVVGIVGLMGVIAFTLTPNFFHKQALGTATNEFVGQMREVQSKAVAQEQGSKWGVFIDARAGATDLYHVFFGNDFATGVPVKTIALPPNIQFNDPPQGQTKEIIFSTLTGAPNQVTTFEVGIEGSGIGSQSNFETISVSSFGVVNILHGQVFNFGISPNPVSGSVVVGNTIQVPVTVSLLSGTSTSVTLSATGQPSGATVDFTPTNCFAPCSSTMTITTASITPIGNFPITVTGAAGVVTRNTTYSLSVVLIL